MKLFQSTPSVGRATNICKLAKRNDLTFQSTPSVGRATIQVVNKCLPIIISIHALRGEGDVLAPQSSSEYSLISIHALRGEGDMRSNHPSRGSRDFNPRPPWGGRRFPAMDKNPRKCDFNPRPPWGGRQASGSARLCESRYFNPRPPWGGRRFPAMDKNPRKCDFNPRPPWGGRPKSRLIC